MKEHNSHSFINPGHQNFRSEKSSGETSRKGKIQTKEGGEEEDREKKRWAREENSVSLSLSVQYLSIQPIR